MATLLSALLLFSSSASALIGQNASQGFGRVGYLHVQGRLGANCIATLLEQDIALTSAHCLEGLDWRRSQKVLFARSGEPGVTPIEDIALHPDYVKAENTLRGDDIALVRLKYEWGTSDPAYCLPERPVDLMGEATVISLQHHEGDLRDQRPESVGTVQIVFRKAGDDPRLILAATKDPIEKLCPGDSGAPVVQNDVLIGIIVNGERPADIPLEKLTCRDFSAPKVLSVYHHREWIKRASAQLHSRQAPSKTASQALSALAAALPSAEELSGLLAR